MILAIGFLCGLKMRPEAGFNLVIKHSREHQVQNEPEEFGV
jgi:hypothetical protein